MHKMFEIHLVNSNLAGGWTTNPLKIHAAVKKLGASCAQVSVGENSIKKSLKFHHPVIKLQGKLFNLNFSCYDFCVSNFLISATFKKGSDFWVNQSDWIS